MSGGGPGGVPGPARSSGGVVGNPPGLHSPCKNGGDSGATFKRSDVQSSDLMKQDHIMQVQRDDMHCRLLTDDQRKTRELIKSERLRGIHIQIHRRGPVVRPRVAMSEGELTR